MDKITIQHGDRIINLHFNDFDSDIDIDALTQINYSNLHAELLTIPALMNRVGILKAEADNRFEEEKLNVAIYEATQAEHFRKTLKSIEGEKVKHATVSQIDNAVLLDQGVQLRKKKLLRLQKEAAYLDSLYWAIKSKEQKLNRIGERMNLTPEEFAKEITEGTWNGILIRSKQTLVPSIESRSRSRLRASMDEQ